LLVMPAMFVGHGSPMNAIESNGYSQSWRAAGEALPRPKAIVVVSAHWYADGAAVTAMDRPRTIHDFYGFPRDLYAVQYPAQGSPDLAARIARLASPFEVSLDQAWGLDHGAWSVLVHLFPAADIPVVQLAIDARQPAAFHWELGAALAPLRDEGVLIMGSGFFTHNLREFVFEGPVPEWSRDFDAWGRDVLAGGDVDALLDFQHKAPAAHTAHPRTEHFAPLFVTLGAGESDLAAQRPVIEGFWGGLAKRSVQLG